MTVMVQRAQARVLLGIGCIFANSKPSFLSHKWMKIPRKDYVELMDAMTALNLISGSFNAWAANGADDQ